LYGTISNLHVEVKELLRKHNGKSFAQKKKAVFVTGGICEYFSTVKATLAKKIGRGDGGRLELNPKGEWGKAEGLVGA